MKIVILDGYTANPGDLAWKGLEALGELTVYDRTKADETVARAADAEVVLTNKVIISREVIAQLPQLRYIGVLATGYNVVDIKAAHERGIIVTNVPAYSTESVAQMVFAHLLTVTNRTEHYAILNRKDRWSTNPDFCYWDTELTELADSHDNIRNLSVAVSEDGSDVVFLHNIVDGPASKSYGIHVARIAGVPEEIRKAARIKLRELESGETSSKSSALSSGQQLSFIPEGFSMADLREEPDRYGQVIDRIRNLDINVMTPLSALNTLQDLIDEINDAGGNEK